MAQPLDKDQAVEFLHSIAMTATDAANAIFRGEADMVHELLRDIQNDLDKVAKWADSVE